MIAFRVAAWIRALLVLVLVLGAGSARAQDTVSDEIERQVQQLERDGSLRVAGITFSREDILPAFYARRGYAPAWSDPARIAGLLGILSAAPEHGLDPADFFTAHLRTSAPDPGDVPGVASRDLLLTEALIRYGYQRRFGKVNPISLEPAWNFGRGFAEGADPVAVLAEAIDSPSLASYLDEKIPGGPWYRSLKAALARYRGIVASGGWPLVPPGPTLHVGDRHPRVAALRERLVAEGDLPPDAPAAGPDHFDAVLAGSVKRFQQRYSLATDGSVGPRTVAAANVPAPDRVEQLRLSLERVRWLAGGAPTTYVVVNVAGFRVGFVKDNKLTWSSRVVVGKAARQTPIFSDELTYVEVNPTWTLPPTILREDVLPKLKEDPGYLQRERMTVLDRAGKVVDPATVNWASYGRTVPFTLRQEPGPENSLGRIKLMFPNQHAVYLHDTPAKELFDRPERNFSSGCIRVEDPLGLATLVLDDPSWTRGALEEVIATGRTRRINLKKPVPILLVYLTATASPDGTVHFFRDTYGRDPSLLAALNGPVRIELPPAAAAAAAELGAGHVVAAQ